MQPKKARLFFTKGVFVPALLFSFAVLFLLISRVVAGEPTGETYSYLPIIFRDGGPVVSPTSTPTATMTQASTATMTLTPTASGTPVVSPTSTATATGTATATNAATPTPTNTPTRTPIAATPTPTNTPTPTLVVPPALSDLVVGQPLLISTPPIIAYRPLEFQVVITNTGENDIIYPFYVDVWLDPTPWSRNANYVLVSSLPSGVTQTVVITSSRGYEYNNGGPLGYLGQVDMGNLVSEVDESNNWSAAVSNIPVATTAAIPTVTATPNGAYEVNGFAKSFRNGNWELQPRAFVQLIDSSATVVGSALADSNSYFRINGIFPGSYTLISCVSIDGQEYSGLLNIIAPASNQIIYMTPGLCP